MKFLFAFLIVLAQLIAATVPDPVVTVAGAPVVAAKTFMNSGPGPVTAPLIFGGVGDVSAPAWAGKVVLLDRGGIEIGGEIDPKTGKPFGISFANKVKRVAAAGGLAVIIANNLIGPVNIGTLDPYVSPLPVVSVSLEDGFVLKAKAGTSARVGQPIPAKPAPVLPDPAGHAGEVLTVDALGEKYIFTKLPAVVAPVVEAGSMASELAVGASLGFSVSANGTTPFTYQWLKDGANIPGATTAVFSIAAVVLSDAGSYTCLVSNVAGSSPSPVHTITIK